MKHLRLFIIVLVSVFGMVAQSAAADDCQVGRLIVRDCTADRTQPTSLPAITKTFTVTTTNDTVDATIGDGTCADSNGACSLRAAVQEANAIADTTEIVLPAGTYTLVQAGADEDNSATGDLDIRDDTLLRGNSAADTIIDANDIDRVIEVATGSHSLHIENLTITNGAATRSGSSSIGGGIYFDGAELVIRDSVISSNRANLSGGGITHIGSGPLTIERSTLLANSSEGFGGAIVTNRDVTITDSLFEANTAVSSGGAIDTEPDGANTPYTVTITNTTFAGNGIQAISAFYDIVTINLNFTTLYGNSGAALYTNNGGTITYQNTLFAANTPADGQCVVASTGAITSSGYNVLPTNSGCDASATGDVVTSQTAAQVASGSTQNNGGPTETIALPFGSAAIDVANCGGITTDQRGVSRPQRLGCDAGAYEREPVAPAVPSNLNAAADNDNDTIDLTWTDNATTEGVYIVERSEDGGTTWAVLSDSLPPNTTTYTDPNIVCGTAYVYRVATRNSEGQSAYSNRDSAAIICPVGAPAALTVTADQVSDVIDLTWEDNATNEDNFIVERSGDGGGTWAVLTNTLPADTTTYTDTTAACGTTYSYRVASRNAVETSGYSNIEAATIICVPADPTNLSVSYDAANGENDLTWEDNATNEDAYIVERSEDGGSTWAVLASTLPADTTTYADDDVVCEQTYTYRVQATNIGGDSATSNTAQVTAPDCVITPPDGLSAVYDSGLHQVDVSWADNATDEDNYVIERQKDGAVGWVTLATLPADTTTYTDSLATCDQDYIYRVTATNADGSSQPTTSGIVATTCIIFSDVPSGSQPPFFEQWIEDFYQAGITTGCDDGEEGVDLNYCPEITVDRGQMAVFILRALSYPDAYTASGTDPNPFVDVPSANQPPFFEQWIEDFFTLGITTGCNQGVAGEDLRYCPETQVNRGQMAVFILRALEGPDYQPVDDPSDPFVDVPSANLPPAFEAWIEDFYTRGITTGCTSGEPGVDLRFCPETAVDRGQMAVFILRAFDAIPDPADP